MANMAAEIITKGRIHNVELKPPLGCSLCMTFWASLIVTYIFCEVSLQGFLVATLYALINAYATKYTYQFILLFEKILDKIIWIINDLT